MVIWSGWGILTIPIAILICGAFTFGIPLFEIAGLHRWSGLPFGLGLLAAAAVNWRVGQRLNGTPGRLLTDQATGQTVVLRRRHSLFFIPMQWWSMPLALGGVLMLLAVVVIPPNPAAPPSGTVRL